MSEFYNEVDYVFMYHGSKYVQTNESVLSEVSYTVNGDAVSVMEGKDASEIGRRTDDSLS